MHRMTMSVVNAALVEPTAASGRAGGLLTGQIGALFAQLFHGQTTAPQMGPAKDVVVPVAATEQKAEPQQSIAGLVQSINRGMSLLDQPSTSLTMTESDYEQVAYDTLWAQQHSRNIFVHPLAMQSADQFGVLCAGHIVDMSVRQQLAAHHSP